jgi:hypothetical protein
MGITDVKSDIPLVILLGANRLRQVLVGIEGLPEDQAAPSHIDGDIGFHLPVIGMRVLFPALNRGNREERSSRKRMSWLFFILSSPAQIW